MALASSLPCHRHRTFYKFKNRRHIYVYMRFIVRIIDHRTFNVKGQAAQKVNWQKSEYANINYLSREILLMEALDQQGIPLAVLLEMSTNVESLKQIHAHLFISGLDQNIFLATKLVGMYATCGGMDNARLVFGKISEQSVFLWNVMIREYVRNGHWEETLSLYYQMQQAGIQPDNFTYPFALKASASLSALQSGKEIHSHVVRAGLQWDLFVGNSLVAMYAKSGSIEDARQLFDKMPTRDVVSWNAMIVGCIRNGYANEALTLFDQMQRGDVTPNSVTIVSVLQACAHLRALQQGKRIHDFIIRGGFDSDVVVGNSLVAMYTKCGKLEIACQLFNEMPKKDVVLWNTMIAGHVQNGHANEALTLFNQLRQAGLTPDFVTMVSVLQACAHLGALQQGKWIHGYIIRSGFQLNVSLVNSIVTMYAKCGSVDIARHLFDRMSNRNVVSWSAMISGYAQNGHATEALALFHQMQLVDVTPDSVTMVSVLQACTQLGFLQQGKWVHDYIIRSGFDLDVFVGNSLIDMYAKCGSMVAAHNIFDKMSKRNTVSWNAIIAGYAHNGHANEALALFNQMQLTDIKPDSITVVSVLQACAQIGALQQGKCIHEYIMQNGFESDVFVQNSLIDMYAKCDGIEIAWQLFSRMSKRNVVSWSAMIAGYAQTGLANEALTLFHQMQLANVMPNSVTLVSVLPACTYLAALQQGKRIHGYIIKSGFESDIVVGTALIDMYAKCGSVGIARGLFDRISERNVVLWSAMIAGYGMHGHGEDALALFIQMQQTGMKPNHITFLSVLSACSHAGLVDEGWQCFDCMIKDYCITPSVQHYACMVDLLGRAGHLDEARAFIKRMPLEPSASVWGSLLGACRIHSNIELGQYAAEHLFNLEPENAGCYVLLSNTYAAAGRWDDVAKVRTMMRDRGLKKIPGCSLIEVKNKFHAFLVGDTLHPQSEKIYAALEALAGQMEEAGYVPNTDFVPYDMEEKVTEHMLCSHSEKVAIAFGAYQQKPWYPYMDLTKTTGMW